MAEFIVVHEVGEKKKRDVAFGFCNHGFLWSLDSYMFTSENFLLTIFAPSPFPSPRGRGEGVRENFKYFLLYFFPALLYRFYSKNKVYLRRLTKRNVRFLPIQI
jgi:hypothetical protein